MKDSIHTYDFIDLDKVNFISHPTHYFCIHKLITDGDFNLYDSFHSFAFAPVILSWSQIATTIYVLARKVNLLAIDTVGRAIFRLKSLLTSSGHEGGSVVALVRCTWLSIESSMCFKHIAVWLELNIYSVYRCAPLWWHLGHYKSQNLYIKCTSMVRLGNLIRFTFLLS